jgi:hypothetical protein
MEPMLAMAFGVLTIVGTKAVDKGVEKGVEKFGEVLIKKAGDVMISLRDKSPETADEIEKSPSQIDYVKTLEKIKPLVEKDPILAKQLADLVEAAKNDPNTKLSHFMAQQPTVYNAGELAEYIENVVQGNTFHGPVTF